MKHFLTCLGFALSLPLMSAGPALSQHEEENSKITSPAPVAYVYVGTAKGVILFDAASNGKLTQVAGSPFPTTGLAIGSNGSYFITLGTNLVHSYPVKSNGAIGGQVSSINTQNFGGGECGTAYGTSGANI